MNTPRTARIILLLSLALLCTSSFAQDTTPLPAGGFFSGIENLAGAVLSRLNSNVTDGMYAAGFSIAEKLNSGALALGGSLALAYLFFRIVRSLSPDGDPMTVVFTDVAIPTVIAAALINQYPARMADFQQVLSILDGLNPNPLPGIIGYFTKALQMVASALGTGLVNISRATSISGITDGEFWLALLNFGISLLMIVPILTIVLFGLAEIAGIILLGPFLFAVGIAFGPLFIVLMVTPWTQDYFGKWIGFVVAAKMVTAVTGVVVLIAGQVFSQMFGNLESGTPIAASLALVAIMLLAVNSILSQIPSIASALVPGTLGVSGGGMTRTATASMRNPIKAGKSLGSGAKAAIGLGRSLLSKK